MITNSTYENIVGTIKKPAFVTFAKAGFCINYSNSANFSFK